MCVDNKVRETIGDVYCPTCRNEKCVYLSTKKTTSFYDCEKCKACCHVLNFLFKNQKPTIMLFGGDGTHCFARKTSRIYEKPSPILKKFLHQSPIRDVDSYFNHNILVISQSHHRSVRVSKGANKKSLAFNLFHFCDSKLQQRFILQEEISISEKETETLLDSLGEFFKAFDQANKVSESPLPKTKYEIGFTKTKDELFSHCYKDIVEHLNRQFLLSFLFEKKQDLYLFHEKV